MQNISEIHWKDISEHLKDAGISRSRATKRQLECLITIMKCNLPWRGVATVFPQWNSLHIKLNRWISTGKLLPVIEALHQAGYTDGWYVERDTYSSAPTLKVKILEHVAACQKASRKQKSKAQTEGLKFPNSRFGERELLALNEVLDEGVIVQPEVNFDHITMFTHMMLSNTPWAQLPKKNWNAGLKRIARLAETGGIMHIIDILALCYPTTEEIQGFVKETDAADIQRRANSLRFALNREKMVQG